jgi:hypothetical protein
MVNFVLLYSGGRMPTSETERKLTTETWNKWYSKLGKSVVEQGNPFTPTAKSITSDGRITDSAVCMGASGYSVIKADSLNAALELAKGCPILKDGGQISVYETFPVM